MHSPQRRLELYALLDALYAYLNNARHVDAAARYTLRLAHEFFRAGAACVAELTPGSEEARVTFSVPDGHPWRGSPLTAFIQLKRPSVPPDTLLAPLRRHGRAWAVLAVTRPGGSYERGEGQALCRIAAALSETIDRIDRERLGEVRSRIDRKIVDELRPKDLFYQILDGIRSLTRYDHSSALLIRYPDEEYLRLEAEQIAWHKGKSRRIGTRFRLSSEVLSILERGEVHGFDRAQRGWTQWHGGPALPLAALLDGGPPAIEPAREGREAPEAALLCATLASRAGAFGLLKISSRHPGSFGPYEADLLDAFRSQAAVAIQNSLRTQSLQARMLEAERKHAMADLARGVSHDVNNALGTALPLVQQMQKELREGRLDPPAFSQDLEQVQESLQLCRRIFGGMLSFARNAAHASAEADVRRAVQAALAILADSLERGGVRVVTEIPDDLPSIEGGQSDLERIFFNLISNARDASPDGGRLSIRARHDGRTVEVLVEDTGRGIAPQDLPRVQEPFFSTKPHGNGLGLSICRSILWQMNGDMSIESQAGRGTSVRLQLPRAQAATGSAT